MKLHMFGKELVIGEKAQTQSLFLKDNSIFSLIMRIIKNGYIETG